MFRDINKKRIILENRKPYASEVSGYIREINMLDWIHSSMRLDGSAISRGEVGRILKGEFIPDVNLSDHALIERYRDLIDTAGEMAAMSYTLSLDIIMTFAKKLAGDADVAYRRGNPVLISLNYNPPHPAEIDEQMEILMNWFYAEDREADIVRKACILHNRIIEVYPFDMYSEAVARAAMYFFLMAEGYQPFELAFSEQEYNGAVAEYLRRENIEPFYAEIERDLLSKMGLLMRLTENNGT